MGLIRKSGLALTLFFVLGAFVAVPSFAQTSPTTTAPTTTTPTTPTTTTPTVQTPTGQPQAASASQGKFDFPPKDTKEAVVLGVAEFQVLRSQAQGKFLGRSAAGLFLERIGEIKTHTVDPAERKAAARGILGSSRRKLLKEIDDLYGKRGLDHFLRSSGGQERKSRRVYRGNGVGPGETAPAQFSRLGGTSK